MREDTSRRVSAGRRGQVLILGGVLLGISFVALAMILNAGIYIDNVSSRPTSSTEEAMYARQAAIGLVNDSIKDANVEHDDDHEALTRNLSRSVRERKGFLERRHAKTGTAVSVTIATITNRTEIVQTNESADFTDARGEANWTLSQEVTELRDVRFHVHTDQLQEADQDSPFVLRLDNGTSRSLAVANNSASDGIEVTITESDGSSSTCERIGTTVWVNVTAGKIGGTHCPGLANAVAIESPTTVQYRNAGNVQGRYAVTVLSTTPANTSHFNSGTATPSAAYGIESVETYFVFRSDTIHYTSRPTVVRS